MLPQEIHNLIIDTIAEDSDDKANRQALYACAAASRIFLFRAYHHLFSHIHLQLDLNSTNQLKSQNALRDFIPLLRSSLRRPDVGIARYVRRFELSIRELESPQSRSALMAVSFSLSELFKAVYSLTRVEYVKMSAVKGTLSFMAPEDGLSRVTTDLVDLCHSPTLSKLALSNFTGVPTSLLRDSRIKHIEMSNVSFASYSWEQRKFIHQPESIIVDGACFHSVVNGLHGGGGLIDSFVRCQEAFGNLRTLEIRSNGVDDVPDYLSLAAAASSTLRALHLHIIVDTITIRPLLFRAKETSGIPKFLFHIVSGLETLRISFHHNLYRADHFPQTCFINPLRYFLEISTLPRSLQTLDIGAKTYVCASWDHDIACVHSPRPDCWGKLDVVLTKPHINAVPRLRLSVKFSVDVYRARWFERDFFIARTSKAIESLLPDFRNTRLLPLTGQLQVICGGPQDLDSLGFM